VKTGARKQCLKVKPGTFKQYYKPRRKITLGIIEKNKEKLKKIKMYEKRRKKQKIKENQSNPGVNGKKSGFTRENKHDKNRYLLT